jgi:mannitol 2-dehydrogenase
MNSGWTTAWPVVCEPFEQWVLEDRCSLGRPPFEAAAVQLVKDVEPYELMKLSLLNASHQGMCYFGYLAGYRYAHEVAQDTLFAQFLLDYMDKEATPTLQPVPGIDRLGIPEIPFPGTPDHSRTAGRRPQQSKSHRQHLAL